MIKNWKNFNENKSTIEDKIYNNALKELEGTKYLYSSIYVGFIGSVFNKSGVPKVNPIPQDYFEIIKTALCDSFHGGLEPEFETEKEFENFENINNEHYYYITEKEKIGYNQNSPYQDKNIPYLTYKK